MNRWAIPSAQIERSFARASHLRIELDRNEQALGRRVQILAKALANLMGPGKSLHRRDVGLHAFAVEGTVCLAAASLEPNGDDYGYRYAVHFGGEAAKGCVAYRHARPR